MRAVFIIYFFIQLVSITSCVQKDLESKNGSMGRFTGDSVSLSYTTNTLLLNMGIAATIEPINISGKVSKCAIKYGTPSLPAGLSIDNTCKITGTPALLTSQFTYTITATTEYNTSTDATVTIQVGTFYNLGGTVSGLQSGQTVRIYNGADTTLVSSDGSFSLTALSSGNSYHITVAESDTTRFTCTVTNGNGTININTNNVQVSCASSGNRNLSGTLSGLVASDGNIQIQNNGTNTQTNTANGSFNFGSYAVNSTYNIQVSSKPPGYTCAITNGSGTLTDNITTVAVVCTPPTAKNISLTVSGLNSGSFNIQNVMTKNDGSSYNDTLTISSNGIYTFTQKSKYNSTYLVSILTQPSEHTCTITNGSGTALADVTNIQINCSANTYSVGGTINGLASGESIKFFFNDASAATEITHNFDSDGSTFTLPRSFQYNRQYLVYLSEVPSGKKCSFTNGTGFTQGFITANISNVDITCTTREVASCEFGHSNYAYPSGAVNDLICDGSNLYVAGSFLGQINQTGTLSELNSSLLNNYNQSFKVEGGSVSAIEDDGNGGFYIGGTFTKVNGVTRTGIAHLYYDGSLDNNFAPTVNGRIRKIVIYNNYLYIGGDFSTVSSTSRSYFAKINRHTGVLDSLNISFNSYIYDMSLRGSKLMIGGIFTTVNSSYVRPCLAELDLTSETITSFTPVFTGTCNVYSLAKDSNNNLYVGGSISNSMGVASLNHLFKLDSSNNLDTTIFSAANSPNYYVYNLKVITEQSVEKLVIGGVFGTIFTTSSSYLAKINLNTNLKESISGPTNYVFAIEEDSNFFYALEYSGRIYRYTKGSSSTSSLTISLDSRTLNLESRMKLINNKLLLSMAYGTSNTYSSNGQTNIPYLFRYNLNTGRPDTSFNLGIDSTVYSMIKSGSSLYLGGAFTSILSQSSKKYLVKVNLSGAPALDSSFTATLSSSPLKIILNGSELITLGSFTTVDSTSNRKYLVSLDPTTGLYRSSVDSSNYTAKPYSIDTDGTSLFISNSSGTEVRKYTIGNPFVYDSSFSSGASNYVYYIKYNNGYLYIGGGSSTIVYNSIATSKYLVRVNSTNGTRDSSFLPSTGYIYGIPFIDQSLQYIYAPYASSIYRVTYSTGGSTTYTPSAYTGVSSFSASNAYIEGTNFYIMGGNFGFGYYGQTSNLMMLPK